MLILICGLPRSGKTTYAQNYNSEIVLHLDTTMYGYQGIKTKVWQTTGDIIIDGVYHTKEHRMNLLKVYQGNYKKCIWLNTPIEIRKQRDGYIYMKNEYFEPPSYDEGWDEIEVIEWKS